MDGGDDWLGGRKSRIPPTVRSTRLVQARLIRAASNAAPRTSMASRSTTNSSRLQNENRNSASTNSNSTTVRRTISSPRRNARPSTMLLRRTRQTQWDQEVIVTQLTSETTENRQIFTHEENPERICPICFEELNCRSDIPTSCLPCGHVFCAKCLNVAVSIYRCCAVCKQPANATEIIVLRYSSF